MISIEGGRALDASEKVLVFSGFDSRALGLNVQSARSSIAHCFDRGQVRVVNPDLMEAVNDFWSEFTSRGSQPESIPGGRKRMGGG